MSYYRLYRSAPVGKAVHGKLYVATPSGNMYLCDTLENADKLVPALVYRLAVTYSPRFKRIMPILQSVPGRAGIRIHRGTIPEHSSGCLLVNNLAIEQDLTARLLAEQTIHEDIRLEIIDYKS